MKLIRPEEFEELRKIYPNGTRVELLQMDDPLSRILDKMSYQYF